MKNCDVVKNLMEEYDFEDVDKLCVYLSFIVNRLKLKLSYCNSDLFVQNEILLSRIQYLESLLLENNINY